MLLRELYIQEDNWTSHKELANIIYKHSGNRQLAVDFFNLETEFDSQDDMQSKGLSALDIDPFEGDRERVNRILSINNIPVKVLKMKHNDAFETLYSLLQSAPVSEAPSGSKYGLEGKPEWFNRAVALKKANPDLSFVDISKEVGGLKAKAGPANIAYWLTGKDSSRWPRLKRSNFPFKPSDFDIGYKQGEKPEWYDRAVQMKLNNPNATFRDIATAIGGEKNKKNIFALRYWLTGGKNPTATYRDRPHTKDWPPFKPEDFPNIGNQKYPDGAKPKWYAQALQMAKAGETFKDIGIKLGVNARSVGQWLVKGQRNTSGTIINPDAELAPRGNLILNKQIKADVENLLKDPKLSNGDIAELIADAHGNAIANMVKKQLPLLRKKQNPGTQVIDKSRTGSMRDPDITGLV